MDYVALIHKDTNSDYGVSFPDFPGCITAGSSIMEARAMAQDALPFHIEGMIEDGYEIPSPSPIEEILKERENRDAIAFLISVSTPQDKYVRVNITMPESLLKEATEYARDHGHSRSAFFVEAVKNAIHKND